MFHLLSFDSDRGRDDGVGGADEKSDGDQWGATNGQHQRSVYFAYSFGVLFLLRGGSTVEMHIFIVVNLFVLNFAASQDHFAI